MNKKDLLIILIAPNVCESMGGEAMKALQIFEGLSKLGLRVIQITHERVREELELRPYSENNVLYVKDSLILRMFWALYIFRKSVDTLFFSAAEKLALKIIDKERDRYKIIVHFTEPNSPVTPRVLIKGIPNIIGPINGNIYYPSAFQKYESTSKKLRRAFHPIIQRLNKIFFKWQTTASVLLVAGGSRTKESLSWAGCRKDQIIETFDCGLLDEIFEFPRIIHKKKNYNFVSNGRLVFHKGTSFLIHSLTKTINPIVLDIIGRGPERENLISLVRSLNLEKRVHFIDWYQNHSELHKDFLKYRGFLFPSLEDANGIVVQEAMALGLPPICLKWGGPELLVSKNTGFLIEPLSEDYVIQKLAEAMDELSENADLAEEMSKSARAKAQIWRWSTLLKNWIQIYNKVANSFYEDSN